MPFQIGLSPESWPNLTSSGNADLALKWRIMALHVATIEASIYRLIVIEDEKVSLLTVYYFHSKMDPVGSQGNCIALLSLQRACRP
jgi:hypothetical protein